MACASQSALDYVQSARDHLVRTLEGFTEIVENLNQKGVFSEEEVSKIKTEGDDFKKAGIIVDSVIKKGEEACYEFLRIIDITRKKSGERPPSFLENAELPSSLCSTFDLNYWISCFSFKEDVNMDVTYSQDPEPCHRYQLKLKSEAQKISERSWTQSKAVLFNKQSSLSYTSLVLDTQGQASPSKIKKSKLKRSRKLRPKRLKTYIPENKPGTSPDDLLKTYEKNILLVGKPGVGKTAVVHQMLKLWSEKDKNDLDYMFYFDMRETPTITEVHKLEDLLFGVFSEPDEGKDEVLEDIKKNADSVTIIFDGVTDVPSPSVVLELIQKTLLPEAKIIITCRPEVESADFLLDWDCLRVEVKGFSEQGIREYLSKNLSEEHLNQVLCNLELFTLCHVPMYALMVAACFSFEGSDFSPHPCTVTEIYLNILHICIQRNVCKTSENERSVSSAILSLAEAAFCATEEKSLNLKSLPQLDSCVHLSFLNMLLIQVGPTVKKPVCAFLHYTVQEFFAALVLVLWILKDRRRTRSVLQQCLTEDTKHMKHLVPLLCGLLNEKNTDLLQSLIPSQQLRDTSGWFFKVLVNTFVDRSEDREIDLVFLCQCLYESQSAEACLCLLDKLDYCVDLSGETLDPQCCCAVSYVISQSEERKIQLNLEDATVSKQGLRSLLGCLNKLQSFCQSSGNLSDQTKFLMNLFIGADDGKCQSDLLWDLCSRVKDYETQTGRSVLPSLQSVFQSAPFVWSISLLERKTSILLEVLKLQSEKKAVQLIECLDEESEVRSFLQFLPYISQLSFYCYPGYLSNQIKFLMNLFIGAAEREQQTGEKILNMLSSVCSHPTFPLHDEYYHRYQCDFLLDLYSCVKDYETQTGRSVLPSLQSVLSVPAFWFIDLSETKTSILLEVLKLQSEKKQVELIGCLDEESEVRSFLQCVPYISQLSFCQSPENLSDLTKFLMNLIVGAAEREQQTGEKILNMLSSVCSYPTFPLHFDIDDVDDDVHEYRLDLLLDLYSRVKDYETQTGRSVLPSLQSVLSAPAVWSISLSETKTSILLEVLKLQSEKKAVQLDECSDEESEVRTFLQCVPYISQLSCDPGFFQRVCTCFAVKSEQEVQQMSSLLQLLDFNLLLTGWLSSETCSSVGRVLGLCGSKVNLSLMCTKISVREASLLFKHTSHIRSLRLSTDLVLLLLQWVRAGEVSPSLIIEELSVIESMAYQSERVLLSVVSSVASLLSSWTVRQLDLSELCIPTQHLTALLRHRGSLTIRVNKENLQQLPVLLHEIQDQELTQCFFSKVGGDLTSCFLDWEVLYFLLQRSSGQTITVNLKKISSLEENFSHLLPFLDRVVFKRPSPSFVLSAIRHIHEAHSSHSVPSLLRSLDHVISLTCTELDSVDLSALLFILHHSDGVKLSLLWTSIPAENMESLLFTLDKVSQLSVDRTLLLRLVHCCAAAQQRASSVLLGALQHRLDLSCSSFMDLAEEEQREALRLTAADCGAISTILGYSSQETRLDLRDCEVGENGLDALLPVLDRVRLRASKALLLQLLSLIAQQSQRVRWAESLWRALDGELDLSHTTLDQGTCSSLAQVLDSSEGLTELDLSHCQLTDQLLSMLIPQLHKVQVLDLSHNHLTDVSTNMLLSLTSISSSSHTVRVFGNSIEDKQPFTDKRDVAKQRTYKSFLCRGAEEEKLLIVIIVIIVIIIIITAGTLSVKL